MLPALGNTLPALETHRADFRSGCVDRAELRRNRTRPCHYPEARAHDGWRRDGDERAGQRLGVCGATARRRSTLAKATDGKTGRSENERCAR